MDAATLVGLHKKSTILTNLFHRFTKNAEIKYKIDLIEKPLGGNGSIMEIDESLFGRAKYNRGRALKREPFWVFGMMDNDTRRVAICPVERRNEATLVPIVMDSVVPATTIYSDEWSAYANLGQGFDHKTVNHSIQFMTADGVNTNGIEADWSSAKRFLRHRSCHQREQYGSLLSEWGFRRNLGNDFESMQESGSIDT
jgi:transposase-like protein